MRWLRVAALAACLALGPAAAQIQPGGGGSGGGGGGGIGPLTTSCGVSGGGSSGAVNVSSTAAQRNNTATTDTITSADCGTVITESNASAVAVSITTAGFATGNYVTIKNKGAGLATYTPTSGTINGNATIACAQNQSADLVFDGTNYLALGNTCQLGALATATGSPTGAVKYNGSSAISQAACADLSNGTALCSTSPGTGVAAAAANNLSAAGGLTSTIASGTSALGTGAIGSAACATVVTTTATNTATTDVVSWGFNGDPTGVTGYTPVTTGALTIFAYPSANNVNFKVCNLTGSSITPGAITLNFRVTR